RGPQTLEVVDDALHRQLRRVRGRHDTGGAHDALLVQHARHDVVLPRLLKENQLHDVLLVTWGEGVGVLELRGAGAARIRGTTDYRPVSPWRLHPELCTRRCRIEATSFSSQLWMCALVRWQKFLLPAIKCDGPTTGNGAIGNAFSMMNHTGRPLGTTVA